MVNTRTSPWRRVGIVAAVGFVALLGELRVPDARALPSATADVTASGLEAAVVTAPDATFPGLGADADGSASDDDDARLVPAVFARDPDVRFVYYRHVSKWM